MNFLQGILTDLRERGLLPVAVALAVALFAVPVLLHKSADAGAPDAAIPAATPAGAPGAPSDQPLVALAALRTSSSLDTFDEKNPFRSLRPVPQLTSPELLTTAPSSGGSSSSGSAGGSGGGSSLSIGAIGGDGGTSPVAPPTAPGAPPSDGGDTPTDTGDDETLEKALFTHEVDIAFGRRGNTRNILGIRRLSMLPSSKQPLLVFLGVDPRATTAMFLVDGDVDQSGEGVCRPSRVDCRFLSLRVDDDQDEHLLLDAAGNEFYFRLREINRVAIEPAAISSSLDAFPPLLDVEAVG